MTDSDNDPNEGHARLVAILLFVVLIVAVATALVICVSGVYAAGAPKVRPILPESVDLEVNKCLLENGKGVGRLLSRLNTLLLKTDLAKNAKLETRIRSRITVLRTVSEGRPWTNEVEKGLGDVAKLLDVASVHDKYRDLYRVFHVPDERRVYTDYNDFGLWFGTSLYGEQFPQCHWVYVYPRWYLWLSKRPE